MNFELLNKLKDWRDHQARKEGTDPFRVLINKTIEEIVISLPKTKDDLLAIKGIKEKKWEKYGWDILAIINGGEFNQSANQVAMDFSGSSHVIPAKAGIQANQPTEELNLSTVSLLNLDSRLRGNDKIENRNDGFEKEKLYTVSDYLNNLNNQLRNQEARIKGEISSLDIRSGYLFFSLKDKKGESLLNCFMWKTSYDLFNLSLEEGMEIIVGGFSEIYKPSGRLSFKVSVIELVGEGVIKKAYDDLK
ncbi:MAG: exodeoxyribonuclease VII large subunit, partial [Candidatus Staskawiczbacteria bacterium]|nr:exodeoxyribonuclease VII large subunit [Candidatus Staskawiczbacteria bacterium]